MRQLSLVDDADVAAGLGPDGAEMSAVDFHRRSRFVPWTHSLLLAGEKAHVSTVQSGHPWNAGCTGIVYIALRCKCFTIEVVKNGNNVSKWIGSHQFSRINIRRAEIIVLKRRL